MIVFLWIDSVVSIEELTEEDIGRWVWYTPKHGGRESGKIKSWNDEYVFVVYNCGGDWAGFTNYTAAATDPHNLKFVNWR